MKICIVGGGIAGLSAAWELEKRRRDGADLEYRLYERQPWLGGVIRTERLPDGAILEAGPDSFLSEKPWAAALCREVGLANELIGSNDAERRTFILIQNRLQPLPEGLQFFVPTRIRPIVTSPLFSLGTKVRFAREYLFPPAPSERADETVAAFVERHFGGQVIDRLADPLLSGIYGGHANQLSVRAVLPRLTQMEADHRSLIRAMLLARKKVRSSQAPLFTSLRAGMQQMTDAISAQLRAEWLRTRIAIDALELREQQWRVHFNGSVEDFDGVLLALPAWAAADLVRSAAPELATLLAGVNYTSSITLNLLFDAGAVSRLPNGFGFLVPRSERRQMLACTFVHNKFPHRTPEGRALLRCFFAAEQNGLFELNDDQLSSLALAELRGMIGITAEPAAVRVARWHRAMAQYSPGHLERVAEIGRLRRAVTGLGLAGNYLRGIGVPDCVRSGAEAVGEVFAAVQPRAAGGV